MNWNRFVPKKKDTSPIMPSMITEDRWVCGDCSSTNVWWKVYCHKCHRMRADYYNITQEYLKAE